MIRIKKNREPASWKDFRNTPGVHYTPTSDLRNALLAEQGYICAFCMRRIPIINSEGGQPEKSKIAHLLSRANHPDRQMDYANMVISCPGHIMNEAIHCDKSQAAQDVNLPVFEMLLQDSMSYSSRTGAVKSSNQEWDKELNSVLGLNNIWLKRNRLETLEGIRLLLEKKQWQRSTLQQKLESWSEMDAEGMLKPYCGIVIWYLKKKLDFL